MGALKQTQKYVPVLTTSSECARGVKKPLPDGRPGLLVSHAEPFRPPQVNQSKPPFSPRAGKTPTSLSIQSITAAIMTTS